MKKVLYWLSIVLPLVDAVRGIVDGVKRGAQDTADDIARARRKAKELEQFELWQKANRSDIENTNEDDALKEDK